MYFSMARTSQIVRVNNEVNFVVRFSQSGREKLSIVRILVEDKGRS